jgi:S1-C subfamily serine protease
VGDIALLKIEPAAGEKFPFIPFVDSDKLEVGQYVLAIGAPFGVGAQGDPAPDGRHYPSVSLGIVSAMHRNQSQYGDCIQTDAAVNPGNSGGPLVDLDGRLAGINGRILTRYMNRVNSGVGFAIPANQIQNFLPRMKEGGINRQIYHGTVVGLDLYEYADERGEVLIRDVQGNSVAADRGFKAGDAILSVNGQKVFNRRRFYGIVSTWPADTEVGVLVRRGEKTLTIKVPLEAFEERGITGAPVRPPPKAKGSSGATFEDEKPGQDGAVTVMFVTPLSPADTAGLLAGDVVLKVDGMDVKNRKTVVDRIQSRRPGDTVTLRVMREGEEFECKIKLGQLGRSEE